jgi:hypothetical protein
MWRRVCIATLVTIVVSLPTLAADTPTGASPAPSAAEAIKSGTPILNLRPRYEHVDQFGRQDEGNAATMRTLAGWRTGTWEGLSATVELIDVGRLHNDYNDGQNGKIRYPVIADPDNTDINQLYLDWSGLPDTRVRAGRQSIKLDNVRFVGNVEFRQVMQVFNGVTVENNSLRNTRIFAGYLGRLKTVDTRQHDTDTLLLNARYALSPSESLVGYGYLQDQYDAFSRTAFSGAAATDTSNSILGLRGDGARPLGETWKLLYTAEYAMQRDYAGGDPRIDANYARLGIGGQWKDFLLRIDREILSSNDGQYGFQTPLGTNHLFQGWADQFLSTPRQGIRDDFLSGGAKFAKVQFLAEYHRLKSDFGGIDFGDEIDLGFSVPLMQKLLGKIEFADYRSGDAGSPPDTRKFWFTLIFNY